VANNYFTGDDIMENPDFMTVSELQVGWVEERNPTKSL
jgi:hypothetical protein